MNWLGCWHHLERAGAGGAHAELSAFCVQRALFCRGRGALLGGLCIHEDKVTEGFPLIAGKDVCGEAQGFVHHPKP